MRATIQFAVIAFTVSLSSLSGAQEEQGTSDELRARELFTAGRAALDVGRPEQARALLAESLSIAPNAGTAFNLSLVHLELGQMVDANALLVRLLEGEFGAIADAQRTIVESKRALSEAGIARVRITIEGDGAELSIDGESVGTVNGTREFALDAGPHLFVGQRGPATAQIERELSGGVVTELALHPIDEAALERERVAQEERQTRRRRRRWALSLTAIAILAAGGIAAGILLQPEPVGLQDAVYGNTETLGFSF